MSQQVGVWNTRKAEEKEANPLHSHHITQNRDANRGNKPVSGLGYTKLVTDTLWSRILLGQSPTHGTCAHGIYTTGTYRQTSFYCSLLYCASQILYFLQIEGLWQPCAEHVY